MFGTKKQSALVVDSTVGKNTKVYGDIVFSGGLHIDGVVVGNVIAESEGTSVTISERGRIEGNVSVHYIQLNGEVVGDVHAIKQIELATNAKVKGNVYYNVIEMSKGAEVNGSLIHGEPTRQQPVTVESQEPIPNENLGLVSEPIAAVTSSPNQPLNQHVNNERVNSMQTLAQPAASSRAENAYPAVPGVFPASVPQQQSSVASAHEHSSPSPAQMAEYLRFANQGGK